MENNVMELVITKRNGELKGYNPVKIVNAMEKAFIETGEAYSVSDLRVIANRITHQLIANERLRNVESIQDLVEKELMTYAHNTAKAYILYRQKRTENREKGWDLSELGKDIWHKKYEADGEGFKSWLERVSGHNSSVARLIMNKKFLFAGRILAGRGLMGKNGRKVSLSNCYVLPQPKDNLESIFDTAKEMGRTYSYGGGCGVDLSLLRPKGSKVNNAALTTSGPVSFMELYDTTTGVIGQNARRGALMLSMSVKHPDVIDFIKSKDNTDKINHANISVRANADMFENIDEPRNKEILREIAISNWKTGEPGMLFWDNVESWHMLEHHPKYIMTSTNPCGEQTLPEYGNCLLGSINLSEYVRNEFTDTASIDWTKLANDVKVVVRGMNDVLDESIPLHPLKEQRQMAYDFRQIGLGIMGLSDMFIKMGIRYGSKDSIDLSDHIAQWIRNNAIQESTQLAKEFGSYPEYDYDIVSKSNYFRSLPDWLKELIYENGLRNSHLLSIAPTGSISTMIDVSGGIEPIFALSFTRTTKTLADEDTTYKVYTKVIQDLMEAKGITKEEDLPDYVITSHEVPYQERIELQATWQQYVDSAISSTINLDESATVEDIEKIYFSAWMHKLKGVTVFRNNCWREGILKTEDEKPNQEESKKIPNQEKNVKELEKHLCPECKSEINVTNGCISCPNCGWGQCSI